MAQDGIFALTYNMALPTGSTSDFIGKYSWRGFGVEGRGFVTDNISLGGSFSWNVFFEEALNETHVDGTQSLTGNFYKYINAYPINFTAHYYFGDYDAKYRFHAGLGIGTAKVNQEVEFGAYQISYNYWHFNIAPDVGVLIPMNYRTNLILSARYNYAFKSNDTEYGWFGFNIGLAWY
jgi:outer membrane protein W